MKKFNIKEFDMDLLQYIDKVLPANTVSRVRIPVDLLEAVRDGSHSGGAFNVTDETVWVYLMREQGIWLVYDPDVELPDSDNPPKTSRLRTIK